MQTFEKWQQIAEKLLIKASFWTYRYAILLGALPFDIDPSSDTEVALRRLVDRQRKLKWYWVHGIVQLWAIFLFCGFINHILYKGSEGLTTATAVHLMVLNTYAYNSLYYATISENPGTCMQLINQLRKARLLYESKGSKGEPMPKWSSILLAQLSIPYLSLTCIVLAPGAFAVLHLRNPEKPFQLYYYLPEGWKTFQMKVVSVLLQTYVHTAGYTILAVAWIYWNDTIFQIWIWLKEIRKGSRIHDDLPRWIRCYQRVLLISRLHNDFNGRYFTTLYYSITVGMCTICSYISLTRFHHLPLLVYLLFPIIGVFTFYLLIGFIGCTAMWGILSPKVLNELQVEIRRSRATKTTKALMLRQVWALQPIRNECQPFGYSQDGTGQALVEQVFNSLLLLFSF